MAYLAQQWNVKGNVALSYHDDCAAAGFPPSRRMVIGISHGGATGSCKTRTNDGTALYQGMLRWTDGPGIYINVDNPACVSGQTRRDHAVSSSIGSLLGLSSLYSSGWASHVMYVPDYSLVGLPTDNEGGLDYQIYVGSYCTPKFSGC